jgi:hypothetical protein
MDLLEQALQLLRKGATSSLPSLFPELLSFYRERQQRSRRFAALYSNQPELLALLDEDLGCYQNAVGALVEQAWSDAAPLLEEVSGRLAERDRAMETVRRQYGFSPVAELDELAWSLHRGRPDAGGVLGLLQAAEAEVSRVLAREFPDPRLRQEWEDLWRPQGQQLKERLQRQPHLSLLPQLEAYVSRHRHWLQRARQRRDFSALPWWERLRRQLSEGDGPPDLAEARAFAARDLTDWPEPDRELRQTYQKQLFGWLEAIETCADGESRSHQVALGDQAYDRWLWLAQSKA